MSETVVQVKPLDVLEPNKGAEWDRLVRSHPSSNPFHCAAWARVINQTYGHEVRYLQFHVGHELVAVIPLIEVVSPITGRRGVCLPFSDACGPLVFGRGDTTFIHHELSRLATERRWDYYEIRDGQRTDAESADTFYRHWIKLSGESEEVFGRFTSATKRLIRKVTKTDLNIAVSESAAAMEEFYRLHVRTRRRHGVPPQPWEFFRHIWEHMIKAGLGFVVLARLGARAVSGAVYFRFGTTAIYKYAASDPKFRTSGGNNLVMWEAIRQLITLGITTLDFGRTDLNNEGLRRFKLSWGAEEQLITYNRFPSRSKQDAAGPGIGSRLSQHVFRRLPLSVNRIVGALAYQHLD